MDLTLKIGKIISDGSGLGHRSDGKAVLVPFVLPGETVEVRVVSESPDLVTARVTALVEASPDRRPPRCPHFGVCGGCDLQHAVYPAQLRAKEAVLEEALSRFPSGFRSGYSGMKIIPSPSEWSARNTAVFHSRAGRIGFFEKSSERIVEPRECPVLEDGILTRLGALRSLMGRDGEIRIRKDNSGQIISSLDREKNNLFQFDGLKLRVWIKNFFQTNTALIPVWLKQVEAFSGVGSDDQVLDLYSGVGIISHFLAHRARHVTGIEADRAAVKRAIISADMDSGNRTYFFAGPVERMVARVDKADVVIMNPPRAGANMSVLGPQLARLKPRRLVYSSCHPSTMFRDLAVLAESGFRLTGLVLLDMFPQTRHFEVVAGLERI